MRQKAERLPRIKKTHELPYSGRDLEILDY